MANLVLVDSNVILDMLTEDERWFSWSSNTLSREADNSLLGINPIVYAEISVGFQKIEDLEASLLPGFFARLELPWEAAFLAGKCFLKYRKGRGSRRSPLPDFYIGAHAAVLKVPLITRDAARYKTYFPSLKIISP
jgi:predicted nucleic acid-binding protein